jgi:hypothetical protein
MNKCLWEQLARLFSEYDFLGGLAFSVVAEAHFGLSEANGIFSLADTVEFLQICLIDTLNILLVGVVTTSPRPGSQWGFTRLT